MPVSPARRIAFDILLRVERDAAFSTELLNAASRDRRGLDRPVGQGGRGGAGGRASAGNLDPRDHALATEIALGCLRRQGEIDHILTVAAGRPVSKLDPEVRAALRIGCYQIRYLDRIPARAAVTESVELVKMARKRSAAGFVNAVLRKIQAGGGADTTETLAAAGGSVALNYPGWMVERWRVAYGADVTSGILRAGVETPPTYLRLNPGFDADETLRLLAADGVELEATELPLALRVVRGRAHESRCFAEGRCRIQDLSSQCVVPLLELGGEHSFLDLCAAPGGKTFQAIDAKGGSRGVVAADRHLHRLRTLRELAPSEVSGSVPSSEAHLARGVAHEQRVGSSEKPGPHEPRREVDCVVLDAQQLLPFRGPFDRILVDAPCSGTGTLARNPEIKWRLRPEDLLELAAKQAAILRSALEALAPAGVLVYSTCSLEAEENQGVVDAVLAEKTSFGSGAYFQRVPGREPGDGFFACQIRRNG